MFLRFLKIHIFLTFVGCKKNTCIIQSKRIRKNKTNTKIQTSYIQVRRFPDHSDGSVPRVCSAGLIHGFIPSVCSSGMFRGFIPPVCSAGLFRASNPPFRVNLPIYSGGIATVENSGILSPIPPDKKMSRWTGSKKAYTNTSFFDKLVNEFSIHLTIHIILQYIYYM